MSALADQHVQHHKNVHQQRHHKVASKHKQYAHNKKAQSKQKSTVAPFTQKQTKDIEQIIHNYLIRNPEVLVEASRALQRKQQTEMIAKAKQAIALNRVPLFKAQSPVMGNPQGDVSLVEFFDYQCKHCKNMTEVVHSLVTDDNKLKVIYKQLPIFGADSEFAARAALAARNQNKYTELHKALMQYEERLSKEKVLDIAKNAGLNVEQLQKDMNDPAIGAELRANMDLAQKIGIMGTPAFIVASRTDGDNIKSYFVAGALSKPLLQNLINEMRK